MARHHRFRVEPQQNPSPLQKRYGWWSPHPPRRVFLLGLTLCFAFLLSGCNGASSSSTVLEARIQKVVSGHTLEVTIPSLDPARIQRVRLIGIDAPHSAQRPWGPDAQKFLQSELNDQRPNASEKPSVQLEIDLQQQDQYQRVLAYVWQDGQLINEVLVAQGYALAASRLPNIRYEDRLAQAQETARLSGLGIWNPANPMRQTPTEFRQAL